MTSADDLDGSGDVRTEVQIPGLVHDQLGAGKASRGCLQLEDALCWAFGF